MVKAGRVRAKGESLWTTLSERDAAVMRRHSAVTAARRVRRARFAAAGVLA
jgi:hypothetical protein